MINPIIKICGINNAEIAKKAVELGVGLIGIVFHPASPRNVNVAQAMAIARATKQAGGSPVAIFVDQNNIEMQTICEAVDIHIVQLHGTSARSHHHLLPKHYQKIYVLNVTDEGELLVDDGLQYLDPARDMILLDHQQPGQGKMITNCRPPSCAFPWLLAGGLTPSNVAKIIAELQPTGVDVSSGVEQLRGHKDISLIQQFVAAVRG